MTVPVAPIGGPKPSTPATERAELAAAARQFEAIFVRQMLAAARKSEFGGDLLKNQGGETFRQMQDEHFADLAANRGAFGLAQMIEAQLAAHVSVKDTADGL